MSSPNYKCYSRRRSVVFVDSIFHATADPHLFESESEADVKIEPLACEVIEPLACEGIEPLACEGIEPLACEVIEPLACEGIEPLACEGIDKEDTQEENCGQNTTMNKDEENKRQVTVNYLKSMCVDVTYVRESLPEVCNTMGNTGKKKKENAESVEENGLSVDFNTVALCDYVEQHLQSNDSKMDTPEVEKEKTKKKKKRQRDRTEITLINDSSTPEACDYKVEAFFEGNIVDDNDAAKGKSKKKKHNRFKADTLANKQSITHCSSIADLNGHVANDTADLQNNRSQKKRKKNRNDKSQVDGTNHQLNMEVTDTVYTQHGVTKNGNELAKEKLAADETTSGIEVTEVPVDMEGEMSFTDITKVKKKKKRRRRESYAVSCYSADGSEMIEEADHGKRRSDSDRKKFDDDCTGLQKDRSKRKKTSKIHKLKNVSYTKEADNVDMQHGVIANVIGNEKIATDGASSGIKVVEVHEDMEDEMSFTDITKVKKKKKRRQKESYAGSCYSADGSEVIEEADSGKRGSDGGKKRFDDDSSGLQKDRTERKKMRQSDRRKNVSHTEEADNVNMLHGVTANVIGNKKIAMDGTTSGINVAEVHADMEGEMSFTDITKVKKKKRRRKESYAECCYSADGSEMIEEANNGKRGSDGGKKRFDDGCTDLQNDSSNRKKTSKIDKLKNVSYTEETDNVDMQHGVTANVIGNKKIATDGTISSIEVAEVHVDMEGETGFTDITNVKKKRRQQENYTESCYSANGSEIIEEADGGKKMFDDVCTGLQKDRSKRNKKSKIDKLKNWSDMEKAGHGVMLHAVTSNGNEEVAVSAICADKATSGIEAAETTCGLEAAEVHIGIEHHVSFTDSTKMKRNSKKHKRKENCFSLNNSEIEEETDDDQTRSETILEKDRSKQKKKRKIYKPMDKSEMEEVHHVYMPDDVNPGNKNAVINESSSASKPALERIINTDTTEAHEDICCEEEIKFTGDKFRKGKLWKITYQESTSGGETDEQLSSSEPEEKREPEDNVYQADEPGDMEIDFVTSNQSNVSIVNEEMDTRSAEEMHNIVVADVKIIDRDKVKKRRAHKKRVSLSTERHSSTTELKLHRCGVCGKIFPQKYNKDRHERTHMNEKPYTCSVCGRGFSREDHLKSHKLGHAENVPRKHQCEICQHSFSRKSHLKQHLLIHKDSKVHECPICKKTFTQESNCDTHIKTHLKKKEHQCTVCHQRFTLKQHLKKHEVIHAGLKPYKCTVCGKSYTQEASLRRHEKCHEGEDDESSCDTHVLAPTEQGRHHCSVCAKSYKLKHHLRRHELTHAGPKPHQCTVCGKSYTQEASLRRHEKCHEGEDDESSCDTHVLAPTEQGRHHCSVCAKSYKLKHHLRRHELTHAGPKPHQCTVCGKSYTQEASLRRHEKRHDGVDDESNCDTHVLAPTEQRRHHCSVCAKCYKHKHDLKQHELTHAGPEPHQCPVCGKTFTRQSSVRRHEKIHVKVKDQ